MHKYTQMIRPRPFVIYIDDGISAAIHWSLLMRETITNYVLAIGQTVQDEQALSMS